MKRLSIFLLLLALMAPWAANAQTDQTLYDGGGTTNSEYVPLYGFYADYGCRTQFIIPAADLDGDMTGGEIQKLTFYLSSSETLDEGFTVYLKEVSNTTFETAALEDWESMTAVYTGTVAVNTVGDDIVMEIDFSSSPFSYSGDNLMIGFQVTTWGSAAPHTYWYGENQSSGSYTAVYNTANRSHVWSTTVNRATFLPKTTITYTPSSTTATAPGVTTNSTTTNLTDASVTLGGTITDMGGASGVYAGICYSTTNNPTTSDGHVQSRYTSAEAYTQNITGLLPNTIYYFRAYAYNSANSLEDPTYGDVYSFTTAGIITLNQPANGEISASVAGGTATTSNTYAQAGQSVTLTATPADGYSLDSWNVTGVTGTASGNTYTFTMPSNNVTVTASIVPTSGGSSSETYYALASTVESGAKYLIVRGNGTTASASTSLSAMEWNNTTSSSGILDYGTPTFKDTEKHKITGITPNTEGHSLSDFVWTITASGSDYTLSAQNGESTYYLIETAAGDGNLHSYTTSNSSYDANYINWTIEKGSTNNVENEYFVIHNSYWHTQNTSRYYYLYYSNGFKNYWSSTVPASQTGAEYRMYLYKETSVTTYAIVATASPAEGGTVAGSDYYANGESCTLTATPAFGYDFVSWTENGNVVSIDATYTFEVSGARTLVANFETQGSCIKPTDLAQVPETQAAHQAQLSWTENSGATQWEVVYSTDSEFDPNNERPIAVNDNPTTIPNLNQETTYYARVRAICGQNSQSGWSDKATFTTISGHQAPTSVSHDPATLEAHKVTITWTGVATNVLHESYDLYYSTSDETPGPSQTPQYTGITATSKEIVGLDAAKTYYVWVRDNCGNDGYSAWTGAAPFTTECDAYTITSSYKYRQNFNSPEVTSAYNSTTGLELPVCWENPYTTGTNAAGKPHLIKVGDTYNYSTSQVLNFYGSGNNYVTLPEFTNDLKDLQISFKWATETNSNSAVLTLGYITEEDVNYNTFTPISDATKFTASETSYKTLIQAGPVELSAVPATAKRLAFRWSYSSQYSCNVEDLVIELIPSCKIPTDFTWTGYTATTATFEWNGVGTNQTAWQLYISETNEAPADDIDQNLLINSNTNSVTISSGLQAEHTYYAWVRGNCTASSEGYSEWSEGIEFMPSAYKDFTYQEEANSSTGSIPVSGYYANYANNKGQMLIPASEFPVQMNDATVRRLTFYTTSSYATVNWGTAEFDVLVAEVDATSFETAAFFDWNDMTTVYSGSLSVSGNQMVIDLRTPFTYTGGNLVIGFNLTTSGTSASAYWVAIFESDCHLGVSQTGTSNASWINYKVKTTFNYKPSATPRPVNPHATEELSTEATLAWTAPYVETVTGYEYQYKLATVSDWSTPETTAALSATIDELTPEQTYDFRVRAIYPGPAYSLYAETQFTTTASCAIPDGLTASKPTMVGADFTWNASSEVDNYTVEYRTVAGNDGSMLRENFNSLTTASTIPEGWDNSEGTTTNANYKWCYNTKTSGNGQAVGPENTPCVVFDSYNNGTGKTNFLKTPAMNFPAGKTMQLSFWWKNPKGDDFSVFISTDGGTTQTPIVEGLINQSTWKQEEIDLTGYEGAENVTIHFKGTSNCGYGDAYIYLDDVLVGEVLPAGAWTEATNVAPNTGAYTIACLNAGRKYDVRVYANCTTDPENENATTTFTTLADGNKVFTDATADGKWGTADNWVPSGVPTSDQNVTLYANTTIESGCTAQAKAISQGSYTITIKDGGKLKHTNTGVTATVEKAIRGYNTNYDVDTYNNGDYYLISNPLTSYVYPSATNGFLVGEYDLYNWSYSEDLEWRNYEASSFGLTYGLYGYLYANQEGTTLIYTGTLNAYTDSKNRYCPEVTTGNYKFPGWYLLGNPYMYDAYLVNKASNGTAMPYIKMNEGGDGFENVAAGTPIEPMQGFFYQGASGTGYSYVTTVVPTVSSKAKLNMNLRNGNKQLDNAILVFGDDQRLGKMSFRANSSKIYMTQEGKDYAIVSTESNVGEIPVSFEAETNGTYTLSFNAEEVSFAYLHLIDNMTGAETDLLKTPSYTFEARTTDYFSRFKLVFATGNNANDDNFAFFSNGSFVINNEGRATLQVIDVNGRILKSESINGCANVNVDAAAGIYMLRLVNGDNIKVQKVVVK